MPDGGHEVAWVRANGRVLFLCQANDLHTVLGGTFAQKGDPLQIVIVVIGRAPDPFVCIPKDAVVALDALSPPVDHSRALPPTGDV